MTSYQFLAEPRVYIGEWSERSNNETYPSRYMSFGRTPAPDTQETREKVALLDATDPQFDRDGWQITTLDGVGSKYVHPDHGIQYSLMLDEGGE